MSDKEPDLHATPEVSAPPDQASERDFDPIESSFFDEGQAIESGTMAAVEEPSAFKEVPAFFRSFARPLTIAAVAAVALIGIVSFSVASARDTRPSVQPAVIPAHLPVADEPTPLAAPSEVATLADEDEREPDVAAPIKSSSRPKSVRATSDKRERRVRHHHEKRSRRARAR